MTHKNLKKAAIKYLTKAFKGNPTCTVEVIQAAVAIVLTPKPLSAD